MLFRMVYDGSQPRQVHVSKCLQRSGINFIHPSAGLPLSRGLGLYPTPPLVWVLNVKLQLCLCRESRRQGGVEKVIQCCHWEAHSIYTEKVTAYIVHQPWHQGCRKTQDSIGSLCDSGQVISGAVFPLALKFRASLQAALWDLLLDGNHFSYALRGREMLLSVFTKSIFVEVPKKYFIYHTCVLLNLAVFSFTLVQISAMFVLLSTPWHLLQLCGSQTGNFSTPGHPIVVSGTWNWIVPCQLITKAHSRLKWTLYII